MQALTEIKRLRKKYNLNQKELAMQSGVSQSLIAKIESGKVEPTYSKAQKIFAALESLREKEEIKANDVMNKKVIFAKVDDKVKVIIQIMKKKGISQIPVLCKERICGLVNETIILKKIMNNPEKTNTFTVGEIMEEAPPIVSPKTGLKTLLELLKENQIVLVSKKGDVKGIISKSDLLGEIE